MNGITHIISYRKTTWAYKKPHIVWHVPKRAGKKMHNKQFHNNRFLTKDKLCILTLWLNSRIFFFLRLSPLTEAILSLRCYFITDRFWIDFTRWSKIACLWALCRANEPTKSATIVQHNTGMLSTKYWKRWIRNWKKNNRMVEKKTTERWRKKRRRKIWAKWVKKCNK